MNIIALILSTAALIVSGVALYRTKAATASAPDAGAKGMGGGGR